MLHMRICFQILLTSERVKFLFSQESKFLHVRTITTHALSESAFNLLQHKTNVMSVFYASVLLLIMNFVITLSK